MSNEIIQSVIIAYDNYDGFQHVNFIFFTKISFHYFEDYVMTKTAIRVRYMKKRRQIEYHLVRLGVMSKDLKDLIPTTTTFDLMKKV